MRPLRLFFITALVAYSALLLADSPPNQDTAERILKSRLEELKKKSIADFEAGKTVEHYKANGELLPHIDPKLLKGPPPTPVYTLEYSLAPKKQVTDKLRELNMAVSWRPNPAIKQVQVLRFKTYFVVEDGKESD